jgi:uncharacterized protein YraI
MHRLPLSLLAGLLLAVGSVANAQDAFTARPVNVRAGPDRSYPVVAQLPPGAGVQIEGCLDDWSWCDVAFDDTRGWAYAPGLTYVYQGERVALYSYAPSLGIPVVTFELGAYWDAHYRGRPFYRDRDHWVSRHIEHMRPPGPPPHREPPPVHATAHNVRPPAAHPEAQQNAHSRPSGPAERAPPRPEARGPEQREGGRAQPEQAHPEAQSHPEKQSHSEEQGHHEDDEHPR